MALLGHTILANGGRGACRRGRCRGSPAGIVGTGYSVGQGAGVRRAVIFCAYSQWARGSGAGGLLSLRGLSPEAASRSTWGSPLDICTQGYTGQGPEQAHPLPDPVSPTHSPRPAPGNHRVLPPAPHFTTHRWVVGPLHTPQHSQLLPCCSVWPGTTCSQDSFISPLSYSSRLLTCLSASNSIPHQPLPVPRVRGASSSLGVAVSLRYPTPGAGTIPILEGRAGVTACAEAGGDWHSWVQTHWTYSNVWGGPRLENSPGCLMTFEHPSRPS